MVKIKEEPDLLNGYEVVYRTVESDIEDDVNHYEYTSIRDQVQSAWGEQDVDIKPKIETLDDDESSGNQTTGDNETNDDTASGDKADEDKEGYDATDDDTFSGKGKGKAKKELICNICEKIFTRPWDLGQHKIRHTGKKNHQCKICQKKFACADGLKQHKIVHGEKTWKCDKCEKTFRTKYNLNLHKLVHTKNRVKYECETCHKTFTRKEGLKRHQSIHNPERKIFECEICHKKFDRADTLTNHKKRVHQEQRPHKCTFCDKGYFSEIQLSIHCRTEHFDLLRQQEKMTGRLHELFQGIRTFECYRCNYVGNLTDVRAHMERCQQGLQKIVKKYKCVLCNFRYTNKASISLHMRIEHQKNVMDNGDGRTTQPEDTTKLFQCFDCKIYRPNWRDLRSHMRQHSRPFKCEYCFKGFADIDDRNKHKQQSHSELIKNTKDRQYMCILCNYTGSTGVAIKHLTEVHGINQFECDICGLKCASRKALRTHRPTHSQMKRYECDVCQKRFRKPCELLKHKQHAHDEEKTIACTFCDKKFVHNFQCVVHNRVEHFSLLRQLDKSTGDLHELFRGVRSYECYRCKFSFTGATYSHMRKHMTNCEGKKEKPVKCDLCDGRFKTSKSRYIHMRNIHSFSVKKQSKEDWLRNAEKSQHAKKVFQCFDCKIHYGSKERLSRHMMIHLGKVPLKCNYCSKMFSRTELKTRHQRRAHSELLTNDIRKIRDENKPTQNGRHSKKSRRGTVAKVDEDHHTKPVKCKLCSYRCQFNIELKRHMRNVHLIAVKE